MFLSPNVTQTNCVVCNKEINNLEVYGDVHAPVCYEHYPYFFPDDDPDTEKPSREDDPRKGKTKVYIK